MVSLPPALRPLYPFEGRRLDRGGFSLHYLDEGSGDPLVMVHGNPSWSFHYRKLVSALRGSYRVIAPDHLGCGLSDTPPESAYRYTLERRVDDLEALLDALGLDSGVTLVLHDWGGMIGLSCAARRPERIARLILLNTAGFRLPASRRLPWELRAARLPLVGALLVRGLNLFVRGAVRACVTRAPMSPLVRAGYMLPYTSFRRRLAVHRFVQDIPVGPGDPAFPAVEAVERSLERWRGVPVLILWGRRDFVFDDAFLAEWRRRLPAAEVHAFDDAGHYVLEDAFDEILPLISAFLRRHPAAIEASP